MYKCPVEIIYGEVQTQFIQEGENMVMKAVRNTEVNVDKKELLKALQYDREQYEEGYADAKSDVLDKIREEVGEEICLTDNPYTGETKYTIEHLRLLDILDYIGKAESEE